MTAKSCRAENRAHQRATIVTAWHIFEECFDGKDREKHIKLPICFCEIEKLFWGLLQKKKKKKWDKVSLPVFWHTAYFSVVNDT